VVVVIVKGGNLVQGVSDAGQIAAAITKTPLAARPVVLLR
jgi:hypothetical protein